MNAAGRRRLGILCSSAAALAGTSLDCVQTHAPSGHLENTSRERARHYALETAKLLPGSSFALLDLDAISRNVNRVQKKVGPRFQLRWVAKSLPSPELLRWLAMTTANARFMVFQAEMISELLKAVPQADLLLGKPLPIESATTVLRALPAARSQVIWLIDSLPRLREYEGLSEQLRTPLRVALEVDVGLRRGGFDQTEDFAQALQFLSRSSAKAQGLRFVGLMGYDGHVPHAEPLLGPGKERAAAREFNRVQERYGAFVAQLKQAHPGWMKDALFDGGGSRTYWRYGTADTPINEISLGSALLKPTHFDDPELTELEPAEFALVPVLKKVRYPFPFVPNLWPWVAKAFPETEYGFYLYGSTWGGQVVWPSGLRDAWFHAPGIQNLHPNQQLLMGSRDVQADTGTRIVVRPTEGDTLAAFDRIIALQSGHEPLVWAPMQHRN